MTDIVITGIGYVGPGANLWTDAARRSEPPMLAPWPEGMTAPGTAARIATITDFPRARFLSDRDAAKVDRLAAIATTAAGLALEDAGVNAPLPQDAAAFFATCRGEIGSGQRYAAPIFQGRPRMINPAQFPLMCRNLFCGQIAIRFGINGHSSMMGGGPLAGLHALMRGAAAIRDGRSRMALVGATEVLSKFSLDFTRLLYGEHTGQEPLFFGAQGGGIIPSEGGCMLVLERRDDALARGARIYARLGPVALGRTTKERGLRGALDRLLSREGLAMTDIGLASCGQTGAAQAQDLIEQTLWQSLGDACPPLAAARSLTGEAESMAGLAQVALAAQALADGEAPPVWRASPDTPLPVLRARQAVRGAALVTALDHAGNHAMLTLAQERAA